MAATVTSSPATPASCYRPLVYKVQRTDPAFTLMQEVFIADASDVSSLGNGLEVGDVVIYYTGSIFGGIPVAAGQTLLLDADCGPYAGVQMVTNAFDDGGDHYAVIDALDQGAFTPASAFVGGFRVWLNNYTFHLRVLVYTDPAGTPQTVDLKAQPELDGSCVFYVDTVIKNYFSHRIETFMGPVPGGGIVQDAHGVTSLFYRVHIAEVYDVPGETGIVDPFDGDYDVLVDDVEDLATMKVAVNAVHPYANTLVDWSSDDMEDFIAVGTTGTARFLTHAPRSTNGIILTLSESDHFRAHLLTSSSYGGGYGVVYSMRVFDMTSGSPSLVTSQDVELDDPTSSFALAVGPSDLSGLITVPDKYRVLLSNADDQLISERIDVTVDRKCKEVRRVFAWMNQLGGVDQFAFTGREQQRSSAKRAVVRKPYSPGTGFDFRARTYRTEVERIRTAHSAPVNRNVAKWIAEGIGESANVMTIEAGRACTLIVLTGDIAGYTSGPSNKAVTVEYQLGVDNLTQQA